MEAQLLANINNLANYMITDSLLWQHGKHTFKFGGEFRFLNIYRDAARLRRGLHVLQEPQV